MPIVTDSATNDQFDFFRRLGAGMQAAEKAELYDTLFSEFKRVEGLLADSRKLAASTDVENIMATPARTRQYIALTIERMAELEAQVAELKKDAERLTKDSELSAIRREHSRLGELIRRKVCGDWSVTVSAAKESGVSP